MLTYQVETWWKVKREIGPLWELHWREIAGDQDTIPLDPDWTFYDGASELGKLLIVTARDGDKLVGYVFALITTHTHYRSTLHGFYDLFWLDPAYRKGWTGYRLMKEAEKAMKAKGVVKAFGQTKIWHDVSVIYLRLGWKPVEILYSKML